MSTSAGTSRSKDLLIVVILLVVIGGGVAAFGFFGDEITTYVRLQGWNLTPLTEANRKFIQAAAKGDGATVAGLVAGNTPSLQPVIKNNRVTGFKVAEYGGPKEHSLKQIAPNAEPKISEPKLVSLQGGMAKIEVTYPGAHTLQLSWDRKANGWKLTEIGWVGP